MAKKDPRIDAYIGKAAPFAQPILKRLRKIVHAGCPEVEETIKWSFPHFDYKGIMCGMAAFQHHCIFGFWKHELIFPKGQGQNGMTTGTFRGRITALSDLPNEKALLGYVRKAAALNDEGVKPPSRAKPKKKERLKIPSYFAGALQKNAKARKTFEDFSLSNKREYIEWVSEAKREETRQERLKTSIKWLAEGKPRNWRYMPKRH
jgi:uncharacterized protein YdeI (YjbR/CyaY-like superfamily)